MAYIRLVILVLAFEVLITAVVGIGVYAGFSVFPYTQAEVTTAGGASQTNGVNAAIPLYMPALSDLKIPYTQLQNGPQDWGPAAVLVSIAVAVLQSFVRGMYLGGMKGWFQGRKMVPLIACGRRYFRDMLAWTFFQGVTGVLIIALGAAFVPLGLLMIVALVFFSLAPYLIVLQDISFSAALSKAPRTFRRYFGTLLPLALLAMLCTFFASSLKSLTQPWGYAVPLLVHALIGTSLIGALMRRLEMKLCAEGKEVPHLPFGEVRTGRFAMFLAVLLVPALVAAGIGAVSGRHLSAFDLGGKKRIAGISYHSSFSDVFYASEQQYTAYAWDTGDYSISMRLPDLSGERKPRELRGIADINWRVDEEVHAVAGTSTYTRIEPMVRKSRLMYRLVRETAEDGTIFYSSQNGAASIMPGGERPRVPLSVLMTVTGDGGSVYVMQYPSSFDISPVFRVSDDGRYLIPRTSQLNPMDFHAYWFTEKHQVKDVFELLAAKNKWSYMPTLNRAYVALAAAMQEGDGRMVVEMLNVMRRNNVNVKAPDWDQRTWTDYLRSRYDGAGLQQTLKLMTKAGVQGGHEVRELPEYSDAKTGTYRIEVPFPAGTLPITYKESKEDGRLLAITVFE